MKKENWLRCEINFETCSSGYIVNFKKVNAGWD